MLSFKPELCVPVYGLHIIKLAHEPPLAHGKHGFFGCSGWHMPIDFSEAGTLMLRAFVTIFGELQVATGESGQYKENNYRDFI